MAFPYLQLVSGLAHRLIEAHAAVRAMCGLGPSICSPGSYRPKRLLALWAGCAIQQHDDPHESGKQCGEREPSQPKAIGHKNSRQNAQSDARKHEQRRLISALLQMVPYRHGMTSYRVVTDPGTQLTGAATRSNAVT